MIALRNTLLLLFGVSIPLVFAIALELWLGRNYLSAIVVYLLWGYVVTLFADAYYRIKRDASGALNFNDEEEQGGKRCL